MCLCGRRNPLVPDGAAELARFFDKLAKDRTNLRIVIHRIVAIDDYVPAQVSLAFRFSCSYFGSQSPAECSSSDFFPTVHPHKRCRAPR